jgi:hypothetical protein
LHPALTNSCSALRFFLCVDDSAVPPHGKTFLYGKLSNKKKKHCQSKINHGSEKNSLYSTSDTKRAAVELLAAKVSLKKAMGQRQMSGPHVREPLTGQSR